MSLKPSSSTSCFSSSSSDCTLALRSLRTLASSLPAQPTPHSVRRAHRCRYQRRCRASISAVPSHNLKLGYAFPVEEEQLDTRRSGMFTGRVTRYGPNCTRSSQGQNERGTRGLLAQREGSYSSSSSKSMRARAGAIGADRITATAAAMERRDSCGEDLDACRTPAPHTSAARIIYPHGATSSTGECEIDYECECECGTSVGLRPRRSWRSYPPGTLTRISLQPCGERLIHRAIVSPSGMAWAEVGCGGCRHGAAASWRRNPQGAYLAARTGHHARNHRAGGGRLHARVHQRAGGPQHRHGHLKLSATSPT